MGWNEIKRRLTLTPVARRRLGGIAIVLAIAYIAFGSMIWWAMNQPPETFGRVMKRLPGPVPFRFPVRDRLAPSPSREISKWEMQRQISPCSRSTRASGVQLSALNKQQPVVLVFGSYT